MDLILWRHADAEDGPPDDERALTARGRKEAEQVGKWLRGRLPPNVRVMASPARRAQQTASALSGEFETVEALGTSTSPEALIKATGWPSNPRSVVVVGHQPTLGVIAAVLLSGTAQSWAIEKAGVIWISSEPEDGMRARLRAAIGPDFV